MNQPAFFCLMMDQSEALSHGYRVWHGFPVLEERNA